METDWSIDLILNFITVYERYPEIWDLKNVKHKNKILVHDAWENIKIELGSDLSIDTLKRKKDSLMTTYRSLKKKVKDSMRSGAGKDEVYKPTWFAFEPLDKFLGSATGSQNITLNTDDSPENENEDPNASTSSSNSKPFPKSNHSKGKDLEKDLTKHMMVATSALETLTKQRTRNLADSGRDQCAIYGELLAIKLRALSLRTQKILMHKIDNVVFEAEMEEMDSSTSHTTISQSNTTNHSFRSNLQGSKQLPRPSTSNSYSSNSDRFLDDTDQTTTDNLIIINEQKNLHPISQLSYNPQKKQIISVPSIYRAYPNSVSQPSYNKNTSNTSSSISLPYNIITESYSHLPYNKNNRNIPKPSTSHSFQSISQSNYDNINSKSCSPLPNNRNIPKPSTSHSFRSISQSNYDNTISSKSCSPLPNNTNIPKPPNSHSLRSTSQSNYDDLISPESCSPPPSPEFIYEEMMYDSVTVDSPGNNDYDITLKDYFSTADP